jgi:hypothetical protein
MRQAGPPRHDPRATASRSNWPNHPLGGGARRWRPCCPAAGDRLPGSTDGRSRNLTRSRPTRSRHACSPACARGSAAPTSSTPGGSLPGCSFRVTAVHSRRHFSTTCWKEADEARREVLRDGARPRPPAPTPPRVQPPRSPVISATAMGTTSPSGRSVSPARSRPSAITRRSSRRSTRQLFRRASRRNSCVERKARGP